VAESPASRRGNDVVTPAVGPLEDRGGDFKDVLKMLGRKDLLGRSIRQQASFTNRNQAPRVSRRKIDVMCNANDRQLPLSIQAFEDIVELDLMF
jgi:hypothetical protein